CRDTHPGIHTEAHTGAHSRDTLQGHIYRDISRDTHPGTHTETHTQRRIPGTHIQGHIQTPSSIHGVCLLVQKPQQQTQKNSKNTIHQKEDAPYTTTKSIIQTTIHPQHEAIVTGSSSH